MQKKKLKGYFISSHEDLTPKQVACMKENNNYLYRAFNQLYTSIEKGDPKKIGGSFRNLLLSGRLPKNDDESGIDTNGLAKKLKALVIALSDENHPENLETFKQSYFFTNILYPIVCGFSIDSQQIWKNYKQVENPDPELKDKKPYDGVLYCIKNDKYSPIGLNIAKAIDTIVKVKEDGIYVEENYTLDQELELEEAVNSQVKIMKNNGRFKKNYIDPESMATLDNEDEDENY